MHALTLAQASALLENLNLHIALLDKSGVILITNDKWREFARHNGGGDVLGMNYLDVCPHDVRSGIQDVMDHTTPRWLHDYPCHSPNERRFFRMEVTRVVLDGETYLLVAHENITAQRLVELQVRALSAALLAQGELIAQYTFATTHTLQEPLRRLTTTSSGLRTLVSGDERVQRYADINQKAAQQISTLIDSLGQYAALGQPERQSATRFNLHEAIVQEAQAQGIEVVLGHIPHILLSSNHALALVHNLMANFKELRTPNEVLHVQAQRDGDFVHLHLRLHELGEHQALGAMNLFQPAGQAALGLSNMLTQQYGGRMWTESGGANIGMHLTLPAWQGNLVAPTGDPPSSGDVTPA